MQTILNKLIWFAIWTLVIVLLLAVNWIYVDIKECHFTCLPFYLAKEHFARTFIFLELFVIYKLI